MTRAMLLKPTTDEDLWIKQLITEWISAVICSSVIAWITDTQTSTTLHL